MSDELIKTLTRKRGSVKAKLTIFSNFIKDLQNKLNMNDFTLENFLDLETRLSQSEVLCQEFDSIQSNLETIIEEKDLDQQYAERDTFCKSYYSIIATAKKIYRSQVNIVNKDPQHVNVKLPPMEVPKFRGEYESWLEFRETFESLVHTNTALSDVQKFHYLKNSLKGSAIEVVTSLEFSADNYSVAWDLLCERYNNTRLLIQNHVKAIFSIDILGKQSSKLIRNIIDTLSKHLKALKQLKQPTDAWDTLIIYIITSKLDKATSRDWEEYIANNACPTLSDMKSFLKAKADLLETLELKSTDTRYNKVSKDNQIKSYATTNENDNQNDNHNDLSEQSNSKFSHPNCPFCKRNTHFIRNCPEFLKLSVNDRTERVRQLKLCINCLRYGHKNSTCRLSNCRKCNSRHNTLLHPPKPDTNTDRDVENSTALTTHVTHNNALLSTVLLQVIDLNDNAHNVRAILDSASQSCFVTTGLCNRLNLPTSNVTMSVTGINSAISFIKYKCEVNIQSQHSSYAANITCFVIDVISDTLPNSPINTLSLDIPKNITLADPSFANPSPIEMLIGANLFWDLISVGQIKLGDKLPILQKTVFGWIISGPLGQDVDKQIQCNFSKNIDIQAQLSKFWELEEYSPKCHLSKEEELCEEHFVKNTIRDQTGRFVVSIPLKGSLNKLGESKTQAEKRFLALERKLHHNIKYRNEYANFMREYEQLGHMRKITETEKTTICFYMPHHGILKETSLTTRLRVVFDSSATTTSGVSFNQIQMVGPTIQNDLISILIRFRIHTYVIAADITKMYRQVLINPKQHSLQRIVWRYDPADPLDIYELQTVTYGTSSAAFLAIRCLFQLALDCCEDFPEVSEIIQNDFYVDDVLFGSDSIDKAAQLGLQLSKVLQSAGFELRKWHSNSKIIISQIASNSSFTNNDVMEIGTNEPTKTLGLAWSASDDNLTYSIGVFNKDDRVTKRVILSSVSQIFDPLGLLSPCVISVKILLQKLWLEKLTWDESVPMSIHTIWVKFKNELPLLNDLKIPRHILCKNPKYIELHCFSDASQVAYGSCLYIRSLDENGNIFVHLLCAKTKVAPLKFVSIPRLELCGAVLSARLANKIQNSLRFQLNDIIFWTDSTIVLGWLKMSPSSLKTFVANRISEIQERTSSYSWRHISTKDNPSDILSRGISPNELKDCQLWWSGPNWLSKNIDKWPVSKYNVENLPELKTKSLNLAIREPLIDFDRFSSLNRLKRSTAYVLRFIHNCKNPPNKCLLNLSVQEISDAFIFILKQSQYDTFQTEITVLMSNKVLSPKSKLFSLNPFIDDFGLLRVGGRLQNSDFHSNKKHPIIISAKHRLCKLVFSHEHLKMLHAGPQLLLSNIRETLWPIGGRNLAKNTVRQCVKCFRFSPKNFNPIMGDLPRKRLEPGYPFQTCGVDYAGPFFVTDRKGRGCKITKCYLALFVCFSVKAVHLELVSDLTTSTFILALKRFVSRRGKPDRIYSDNGTNFVGANAELRDLGKFLQGQQNDILKSCVSEGIDWRFIPVNSPHFGGLWEAGVKSSKYHLKRVVGKHILTFEEMYTVFAQIEAVLNSRPISPLTTDPNDLNPLTPAHFLIGKSLLCTPEPDISNTPTNRLSRYQMLEQMRQNFWTRWSKEYVSEMQQRLKWKKNQDQVKIGTLVLVKEDNLPPMRWKLGKIISTHPGKDEVVRVVSIKTSTGVIKRACQKICPLPFQKDVESELFQDGEYVVGKKADNAANNGRNDVPDPKRRLSLAS